MNFAEQNLRATTLVAGRKWFKMKIIIKKITNSGSVLIEQCRSIAAASMESKKWVKSKGEGSSAVVLAIDGNLKSVKLIYIHKNGLPRKTKRGNL